MSMKGRIMLITAYGKRSLIFKPSSSCINGVHTEYPVRQFNLLPFCSKTLLDKNKTNISINSYFKHVNCRSIWNFIIGNNNYFPCYNNNYNMRICYDNTSIYTNLTTSFLPFKHSPIYSSIRWKHTDKQLKRLLTELNEDDLEEYFMRGDGPGGQATNKTANCVRLFHKPTGLDVKCHHTRSLDQNREIARFRLRQKLDVHLHGKDSIIEMQKREDSIKKSQKRKRTNEKLKKLKAFKEREGID